jgi:hypothetical protein
MIANKNLVVRPQHSNRRTIVYTILIVAGIATITWLAYRHGLYRAGFAGDLADKRQHQLGEEIHRLTLENANLRDMLAHVQRQLQIDHTAYKELDTALQASTASITELREELNFYRKIFTPREKAQAIQIKELQIEALGVANQYRYKLVLFQAVDHKKEVKGTVRLQVAGLAGNEKRTVDWPSTNGNRLSVKFRYFQNLEGIMSLPPDFKPVRVKVRVTSDSKRAPVVEKWYAWPLA